MKSHCQVERLIVGEGIVNNALGHVQHIAAAHLEIDALWDYA